MSNVPGSKLLPEYDDRVAKQLAATIFVTVELDGETDAYRSTYDTAEDAVDAGDHESTLVATYKLVKIEELALKRSTAVVKVK
jgi:hypothetical protein